MSRRKHAGVGLLAAALALFVGRPGEVRAALTYEISLGLGAQQNDNLHLDPQTPVVAGEPTLRQPVRETIFTVNPALWLLWVGEYDRLALRYDGRYSLFEGDEELDSFWTHAIGANLTWRRWSPFFLEVGESRTRVPRTQNLEGAAFVDQIDRNRITVRSGVTKDFGTRSTVELGYRGEMDSYTASGAAAPPESGAVSVEDQFDRVGRHSAEALIRHRWSPLWRGELRLGYGHVDRVLAADFTELDGSLTLDQRWNERLTLRYWLEFRREDDEAAASEETAGNGAAAGVGARAEAEAPAASARENLLLGLEVRGDLERGGWWTLGYRDAVGYPPDGDTLKIGRATAAASVRARLGSALDVGAWRETRDYRVSGREETAWGPSLRARWLITPTAALDLAGSWTSTSIRETGREEISDETIRAAVGIVFLFFKRVQFEAGYGYRENDSSDPVRSYANNLLFALLTYHFTPVAAGRLPLSYTSSLVAGGSPSGGAPDADGGTTATGAVR